MFQEQYKCVHFDIWELVSKEVYEERGEKAWQLLDVRMLMVIDLLRQKYGKITINDWKWGGKNQSRGLRTPSSKYYRKYSQHTYGRAFDLIFHDITAEEVRQDILKNPESKLYKYITSFEENTSWLHIDTRNCDRILTFPIPYPK